jgi:hypothetical protein
VDRCAAGRHGELFDRLELTVEVTVNESLLGPTNGRVMFGFVFGRRARPRDLEPRHAPRNRRAPGPLQIRAVARMCGTARCARATRLTRAFKLM